MNYIKTLYEITQEEENHLLQTIEENTNSKLKEYEVTLKVDVAKTSKGTKVLVIVAYERDGSPMYEITTPGNTCISNLIGIFDILVKFHKKDEDYTVLHSDLEFMVSQRGTISGVTLITY